MAKQRVSLVEIAKEVGLSKSTVSFVLNNRDREMKIAPATARRVHQAARKLGYRSNHWAKSLARQKTLLIGLLFPDLRESAAHMVAEGVYTELEKSDYQPLLGVYFWDTQRHAREIELMLEKRVDGIIALPHANAAQDYELILANKVPLVLMGDYFPEYEISSITLDPQDCVRSIVRHLRQLGHRSVHLLTVAYNSPTLKEREEAFRREMVAAGCPIANEAVWRTVLGESASVAPLVQQMLSLKNRPTALACISDSLAIEVLTQLDKMGLRAPADLAVTGIGNLPQADNPFISLTTVNGCWEDFGWQAARLIMEQLENDRPDHVVQHVRLKGELFARRTTLGQRP